MGVTEGDLSIDRCRRNPGNLYNTFCYKHLYYLLELGLASISNPCSLVVLELFFCVFSVPRPFPALVLAAGGSPRQ